MTIIGAVVLATSAQAAAVAWSSGSNSNGFKDPTGTTLKNSAAYTMIVTFWDGTTELGTSSDTTASSLGAYTGTFSGYDFAADKTYYASAIISANDGSYTRSADKAAFTIPGDNSDASINFFTGSGFDTAGVKWGDWAAAPAPGPGPEDVPEPTSGLRMLFGAAGLALRRQRA